MTGRWLWVVGIVGALNLLGVAWSPAFDAPYQYDDTLTPLKDPASQSLAAWAHALPRTLRPLTKLSYALESDLDATSAPARRVVNGVLFVVALSLLARLLAHTRAGFGLSIALATLWALHPAHAETIIALAGRSVLLSLTLCLASALCVLEDRPWLALLFAFLAVLARETALPWMIVAVVLVCRPRLTRRGLWTALAGSITLGVVVVFASARMRQLLLFSWDDPAAGDRLGMQWAALPRELAMWLFEPDAFAVDIEFAPRGMARLAYLLAAVCLYALFAWLSLCSQERAVRVAALLWLSLVLPLHSLIPKLDPLTARSVSAHSSALVMLIAVLLREALRRDARTRYWIWTALAVSFALLVPITRQRAALYRDPVALWRDAADRSHESTRPLVNLGTLLAQKGQLREAHARLREAVRRDPHDSDARERLAGVEVMLETQHLLMEPASRGNSSTP